MSEKEKKVVDALGQEVTLHKRLGVWESYVGEPISADSRNDLLYATEQACNGLAENDIRVLEDAKKHANNLTWISMGFTFTFIAIILAVLALVVK